VWLRKSLSFLALIALLNVFTPAKVCALVVTNPATLFVPLPLAAGIVMTPLTAELFVGIAVPLRSYN